MAPNKKWRLKTIESALGCQFQFGTSALRKYIFPCPKTGAIIAKLFSE